MGADVSDGAAAGGGQGGPRVGAIGRPLQRGELLGWDELVQVLPATPETELDRVRLETGLTLARMIDGVGFVTSHVTVMRHGDALELIVWGSSLRFALEAGGARFQAAAAGWAGQALSIEARAGRRLYALASGGVDALHAALDRAGVPGCVDADAPHPAPAPPRDGKIVPLGRRRAQRSPLGRRYGRPRAGG